MANNSMKDYTDLQQQFQAIQSERAANTAAARSQLMQNQAVFNTVQQASELAPSTQNLLSKYNGGKPVQTVNKSTQTTPQNITINNTTVNNGASGPVQGRDIQMMSAQQQDATNNKFKVWISQVFGNQKEEMDKQERYYDRRDSELNRSQNKLLQGLNTASKEVVQTFDPKNIGTTVGNQLKVLLFLFGGRFIAKNFERVLEIGHNIAGSFSKVLGYFGIGKNKKPKFSEGSFTGDFNYILTGRDSMKAGDKGTFAYLIELWQEHQEEKNKQRRAALDALGMPSLADYMSKGGKDTPGWAKKLGSAMGTIMQGAVDYLKTMLTIAIDPARGLRSGLTSKLNKQASESTEEDIRESGVSAYDNIRVFSGNKKYKVSTGDYLINNRNYNALSQGSLDYNGRLVSGAGNTILQGRDILGAYNNAGKYGKVETARLSRGIERLREAAQRDRGVIVSGDFLMRMNGGSIPGYAKPVYMKYVLDDMSKLDKEAEYREDNLDRAGNIIGTVTGAAGAIVGGVYTGHPVAGGALGAGIGKGTTEFAEKGRFTDKKVTLVLESDPRPALVIKGKLQTHIIMYHLSPEDLDKLVAKRLGIKDVTQDTILEGSQNSLIGYGGGLGSMASKWRQSGKKGGQFDYDAGKYKAAMGILNTKINDRWTQNWSGVASRAGDVGYRYAGDITGWLDENTPLDMGSIEGTRITDAERKKNVKITYDFFRGKGLTHEQTVGILGVLYQESTMNPNAYNSMERRKYPRAYGRGLAQWSSERVPLFAAWLRNKHPQEAGKYSNNLDIRNVSIEDQLEFMWYEMCGRPAFQNALSSDPTSIENSTRAMYLGFENGSSGALASESGIRSAYHHSVNTGLRPRLSAAKGVDSTIRTMNAEGYSVSSNGEATVGGTVQANGKTTPQVSANGSVIYGVPYSNATTTSGAGSKTGLYAYANTENSDNDVLRKHTYKSNEDFLESMFGTKNVSLSSINNKIKQIETGRVVLTEHEKFILLTINSNDWFSYMKKNHVKGVSSGNEAISSVRNTLGLLNKTYNANKGENEKVLTPDQRALKTLTGEKLAKYLLDRSIFAVSKANTTDRYHTEYNIKATQLFQNLLYNDYLDDSAIKSIKDISVAEWNKAAGGKIRRLTGPSGLGIRIGTLEANDYYYNQMSESYHSGEINKSFEHNKSLSDFASSSGVSVVNIYDYLNKLVGDSWGNFKYRLKRGELVLKTDDIQLLRKCNTSKYLQSRLGRLNLKCGKRATSVISWILKNYRKYGNIPYSTEPSKFGQYKFNPTDKLTTDDYEEVDPKTIPVNFNTFTGGKPYKNKNTGEIVYSPNPLVSGKKTISLNGFKEVATNVSIKQKGLITSKNGTQRMSSAVASSITASDPIEAVYKSIGVTNNLLVMANKNIISSTSAITGATIGSSKNK